MINKDKSLTYDPKKVNSLIENIPLNKSKLTENIQLYISKNITLYQKKPAMTIFVYLCPENSLSEFQNYSLRLSKKLKKFRNKSIW